MAAPRVSDRLLLSDPALEDHGTVGFSLGGCQPNRVQAKHLIGFRRDRHEAAFLLSCCFNLLQCTSVFLALRLVRCSDMSGFGGKPEVRGVRSK
jgi:hypothetical protein